MRKIGKYEIRFRIGEGAMGVVYKAFDPSMRRSVAIKIPHVHLCVDPKFRARFFHEARINAQLSHSNIISVYDIAEIKASPYLVMEYVDGRDLKTEIARPKWKSLEDKVRIMIEVCRGLGYAHGIGVVHRDIKPSNIKITASGQVKILDFGLARMASEMTLTTKGTVVGTLSYMAPERFASEDKPDHQAAACSDIYSAGVVFYELLGNRKAFQGDTDEQVLHEIFRSDPVPLLQLNRSIPDELARIVHRAMAKKVDQRYQEMGDLLADLDAFQTHLEEHKERLRLEITVAAGDVERFIERNQPLFDSGPFEAGTAGEIIAHPRPVAGSGMEEAVATLPETFFDLLELQQRTRCTRELLQSFALRRQSSSLLLERAAELERTGDLESALGIVRGILEDDPGHRGAGELYRRVRNRLNQGQPLEKVRILLSTGDLEDSLSAAKEFLACDPQNSGADALLDDVRRKIRERQQARGEEQKKFGLEHLSRCRYQEALTALRRAAEMLQQDPEVESALVRTEAAIRAEELGLWIRSEIEGVEAAYEAEDWAAAEARLQGILEAVPDDVEGLGLKARIDEAKEGERQRLRWKVGAWSVAAGLILLAGILAWLVIPGRKGNETAYEVPRNPAESRMTKAPLNANLRVRTNQPDVRILIGGKERGATGPDGSAVIDGVPPGGQDLKLLKDGYGEWSGAREFSAGGTIEIEVSLIRLEVPPGLAALRVTSEPPGADVTLMAGNRRMSGITAGGSFTFQNVSPGKVRVHIEKTGYASGEADLSLPTGKMTTQQFVLKPLPVALQLATSPAVPKATLKINGNRIAATDSAGVIAVKIDPGQKQVLELEADGYERYVSVLDFNPGEPQSLTIRLSPRATVPSEALLSVSSTPTAADVFVDEKLVGRTPLQGIPIQPGQHELMLSKLKYRAYRRQVSLTAGNNTFDNLQLEVESGRLKFQVEPPGVVATIEGQGYKADLENEIVLPTGLHAVLLAKDGYVSKRVDVKIVDQQTAMLHENLERSASSARRNEGHSDSFLTLSNWENDGGWVADGALHAKGAGTVLLKDVIYDNFVQNFQLRLVNGTSASVVLRAKDKENLYLVQVNGANYWDARLRMTVSFYLCKNGKLTEKKIEPLPFEGKVLRDWIQLQIEASGNQFKIKAGGRPLRGTAEEWVELARFVDEENTYPEGRIGFRVARTEAFDVTQLVIRPVN